MENTRIYSWYSLPDLKYEQKRFIRTPSSNVLEMRLSGTFSQFYQTVTMVTMTRYNNLGFDFGYVFSSSMTVQCFITIKWQEKKLSMIKIFNFFVF